MNVAYVRQALEKLGRGPVLVHSDMLRVAGLVGGPVDRTECLKRHLIVLQRLVGDRDIWMPAFNYDFTRTRLFDVRNSPSQVGPFSEFFRRHHAVWRTPVPVFSVCGLGRIAIRECGETVDPFDAESAFGELVRRDGIILFYGAPFSSATFIHHVERVAGGPLYRYDKRFEGDVVFADGTRRRVCLLYHVRPIQRRFEYDWPRLRDLLVKEGVLWINEGLGSRLMAAGARALREVWVRAVAADPLYLLDSETRSWVAPMLERLGRRFHITDFEEVPPDSRGV